MTCKSWGWGASFGLSAVITNPWPTVSQTWGFVHPSCSLLFLRHPSNLMLDRLSGKILHIDFGDCFEVSICSRTQRTTLYPAPTI